MPVKSIRFPDSLAAAYQARADELERSFSWVVLKALESALDGSNSARSRDGVSSPPSARNTGRADSSRVSPVSSRAPVEKEPLGHHDPNYTLPAPSLPPFRCPVPDCAFAARSSAAKCGMHGRTVVPA